MHICDVFLSAYVCRLVLSSRGIEMLCKRTSSLRATLLSLVSNREVSGVHRWRVLESPFSHMQLQMAKRVLV
jgi:hypothetical protein